MFDVTSKSPNDVKALGLELMVFTDVDGVDDVDCLCLTVSVSMWRMTSAMEGG